MSKEVKLKIPKMELVISTYPMRIIKGDKEIWICDEGDIIAVMIDDECAEEYTINVKKDFDSLWGFIVNVTEMKLRKEDQ